MRRMDGWVLARVESFLRWVNEWLGVSTSGVEVVLIVTFVFGRIAECVTRRGVDWRDVICDALGLFAMVDMRRLPSVVRMLWFRSVICFIIRCSLICLLAISLCIVLVIHKEIIDLVGNAVYTLFLYVIGATIDGQRGRRAKLAWSKIKELFGGAWWIPAPQEG